MADVEAHDAHIAEPAEASFKIEQAGRGNVGCGDVPLDGQVFGEVADPRPNLQYVSPQVG
jgi:hypothetical protein